MFLATSLGSEYPLSNQMDKASGSIMDNIAEVIERNGNKDSIQYLSIAKASCGELRSQLYRALDRKHLDISKFDSLTEKLTLESNRISAFLNYLIKSEYKGSKHNKKPRTLNLGVPNIHTFQTPTYPGIVYQGSPIVETLLPECNI